MQPPDALPAPEASLDAHADSPLVAALLEPGGLRRRWLLPLPEDDDGDGGDGCGAGYGGGGSGAGSAPLPASLSADGLREATAVSAALRVEGVPCGATADGYGTAMRAAFLVRDGGGVGSCGEEGGRSGGGRRGGRLGHGERRGHLPYGSGCGCHVMLNVSGERENEGWRCVALAILFPAARRQLA